MRIIFESKIRTRLLQQQDHSALETKGNITPWTQTGSTGPIKMFGSKNISYTGLHSLVCYHCAITTEGLGGRHQRLLTPVPYPEAG